MITGITEYKPHLISRSCRVSEYLMVSFILCFCRLSDNCPNLSCCWDWSSGFWKHKSQQGYVNLSFLESSLDIYSKHINPTPFPFSLMSWNNPCMYKLQLHMSVVHQLCLYCSFKTFFISCKFLFFWAQNWNEINLTFS